MRVSCSFLRVCWSATARWLDGVTSEVDRVKVACGVFAGELPSGGFVRTGWLG